jgi:hypothetical protein
MSEDMIALFECEIGNEHCEETGNSRDGMSSPGGDTPATLSSCLDSIEQGLELDGIDMDELKDELNALISIYGAEKKVADLLPNEE